MSVDVFNFASLNLIGYFRMVYSRLIQLTWFIGLNSTISSVSVLQFTAELTEILVEDVVSESSFSVSTH